MKRFPRTLKIFRLPSSRCLCWELSRLRPLVATSDLPLHQAGRLNLGPPMTIHNSFSLIVTAWSPWHTNELDVRQLLELLSRAQRDEHPGVAAGQRNRHGQFRGCDPRPRCSPQCSSWPIWWRKKEGSIHYISTKQEIQDEAETVKKERILTKVYKLNYVRSDEMMAIIRPFLSVEVGQKTDLNLAVVPVWDQRVEYLCLRRGDVSRWERRWRWCWRQYCWQWWQAYAGMTGGAGGGMGGAANQPSSGGNSLSDSDHLVIQDYESNLKIIDQIIERVDIRPVQVLIEAVIVSVDLEHDRELGVNFAVVDNLAQMLGTVGSGSSLNGNVGFNPTQLLTAAGQLAQGATADPQGFTSATNGVKFGFVANNVTGFVRALETLGSTKVLASSRILVLNKQRAEIQLGARLGFQTLSQNFTSTIQQVQFLNTGTLLRLRPFVSDDGMVRMEIHPERSTGVVSNNVPSAQTAELTTNVMVPDGATLVIGGLMEDEDDYQMQGLPGLSRIPALGYLFGARQKNEGRRELVVLLTPHIWSPDQAMAHAPSLTQRTQEGATTPPPAFVSASLSGSGPQAVANVEPGPAGKAPGQEQPGATPYKRRPWLSLGQLLPWRSTARKQEQSPDVEPRSKAVPTATSPVAPLAARTAKSDVLVTPARWGPGPTSNPTQDEPIRRSRADSGPANQARSIGIHSGVVATEPIRHTVRRGESFATIAQIYYGSGRYQQAAWWANRGMIARPERLTAGDQIVIPRADQLDASQIGAMRSTSTMATVPSSAPAPFPLPVANAEAKLNLPGSSQAQSLSSERTVRRDRENVGDSSPGSSRSSSAGSRRAPFPVHVVRRYETLWSIARDRLGNAQRADEIIKLNQDRLPGTNQLTPGQRLLLPFDAMPAPQMR